VGGFLGLYNNDARYMPHPSHSPSFGSYMWQHYYYCCSFIAVFSADTSPLEQMVNPTTQIAAHSSWVVLFP
jgi:hypothetical protein